MNSFMLLVAKTMLLTFMVFCSLSVRAAEQILLPDQSGDGAAEDYFGMTVEIYGPWLTVGAHGDDSLATNSGAVYVYEKVKGTYVLRQVLLPPLPAVSFIGFGIGQKFSSSGRLAVESGRGVYVFELQPSSVWEEIGFIPRPPPEESCQQFSDAAIYDDWVFVYCSGGRVKVIIYRMIEGAYVRVSTINPPFGTSMGRAIEFGDEGRVAIQASGYQNTAGEFPGGAYLYELGKDQNWHYSGVLTAADGLHGDQLGAYIRFCGSYILIGAPEDDTIWGEDAGSVYRFDNNFGNQTSATKFAPNVRPLGNFGRAISCSNGRAASHAFRDGFGVGVQYTGTVTLFDISPVFGANYSKIAPEFLQAGSPGDRFGEDLELVGETLIAGMHFRSIPVPLQLRAGAVYVNLTIGDLFANGFEGD